MVLIFLFSFIIYGQQKNLQQEIDILYNAAVEKYIKNDYDKAVEYMQKVYSLSKEQKYKNFIIKLLYEAANSSYMKQEYKKAYEYTSKALNYTTEDEKINKLHKILKDILEKEETKIKKIFKEEYPKQEIQKVIKEETQPPPISKKQKEYKIETTTQTVIPQISKQIQVVENKLYKILFFILLSLVITISTITIFLWTKFILKTKQQLQQKVLSLQQENVQLKTELIETKKEVALLREKEKVYENEIKERKNIINVLQEQINNLYKEKESFKQQTLQSKPTTQKIFSPQPAYNSLIERIFNQRQSEITDYISKLNQPQVLSEYELEIYREKIAAILKALYELNPQRTYDILENMIKSNDPLVRTNVVVALVEIATEKTFSMLFKLYSTDEDVRVKREVLKYLIRVKNKIDNQEVSLPKEIEEKIIDIVKQEKSKGEWLF
ncbi:MAG: HEAT repeat domain-containing protein [Endomicrobiia bacterium]